MTEVLGYPTYLAQGGDWGALVTSWLGLDHAEQVPSHPPQHAGLARRRAARPPRKRPRGWPGPACAMDMLGAYFRLQVSKPQSVAWLGAGNPVGQAAWIVERFYDW